MTTTRKVTLTTAQARAVEALRRCDAEAVKDVGDALRSESWQRDDEAAYWRTHGRNSEAKAARNEARAHRAIARVVRALLVTALALACAGCEAKEPCHDGPPDIRYSEKSLGMCGSGRGLVAVPGIGWTCACPGSPLLDGGR